MHKSVLLEESIENLNLSDDAIIVDATLGYAGHSSRILEKVSKGFLYSFDQDINAIEFSQHKLEKINDNFEIINSNFVNIKEELNKRNVNLVNGILFDLGVSSPQLDQSDRGFSFHQDAALDMRMNQNSDLSAYEVVNNYTYNQLVSIFLKYGEEKYSTSIARNIEKERQIKPIETTLELVEIIKKSVPEKYRREKHPARKIFQAIRIEVNDELNVCEKAMRQSLDLLDINGYLCVITFHSLEDKIVKRIFNEVSKIDSSLSKLPIIPEEYLPKFEIIANITPSTEELDENNRARSSRLRVIKRIR
ncbi:MAG: 16S rRNA (cytosine(1402)-N(4))-methyltransferase RsmH [Mycoplasmatota bacterium]